MSATEFFFTARMKDFLLAGEVHERFVNRRINQILI
jgi:hypothetical protein